MPTRPRAQSVEAWQNRRFGLFIHLGLYSIPAGHWSGKEITGYSEQIRAHAGIPKGEYAELANQFNPIKWDPDAVAKLAKAAGMKFVVLTAKHHDGFSLFHTQQSKFNVVDGTPYRQDIVKGLAEACRREGLEFGVYFSTIDWNFEGATGIDYGPDGGARNDNFIPEAHEEFNVAQLKELMTGYGPISEVWFDMGHPTEAQSRRFADTVHDHQSESMVSGRVFNYQGDFTVMGDNEIPPYPLEVPWQAPASIFHETWGYREWQRRDNLAAKTAEHLRNFIKVISRGGNYLLNIGPRGDGSIVEYEADLLHAMGNWIAAHAEAIEGANPQPFRHLEFGAATWKPGRLFLFVWNWPADGIALLPGLKNNLLSAKQLGSGEVLQVEANQVHIGSFAPPPPLEIGKVSPPPLPVVIEVTFEGDLEVLLPSIAADSVGNFNLSAAEADKFYQYNGAGYDDPPILYRLRWHIQVQEPGSYELQIVSPETNQLDSLDLLIGSKQQRLPIATLQLPVSESLPVEVRLANPDLHERMLESITACGLIPRKLGRSSE